MNARVAEGGELSSAQAAVSGIAGGAPAQAGPAQTALALPRQLIFAQYAFVTLLNY